MSPFRAKDVLKEAKFAEKKGKHKYASKKYAKLADYLVGHGRHEEAIPLLNRAIRLHPLAPRLYLEKALCEVQLGRDLGAIASIEDFARAALQRKKVSEYGPKLEEWLKDYPVLRERYYRQLVDLDRTDAALFLGLAAALIEQGKLIEAQGVLVDALEIGGQRKSVIGMLRQVLEGRDLMDSLFYLQRFESGELSRQELILLLSDPGHIPRVEASEEGEATLGTMINDLVQELGIDIREDRDEVYPLLKEFRLRSEPILGDDARSRMDMAVAYFEMGFVDTALEELAVVSQTHPLYLETKLLGAEILFREERFLQALEVYKSCLRNRESTEAMIQESLYKLSKIYFELGDIKKAWELVERLVERDPDYRDLKHLRVRIADRIRTVKRSA